MWLSTLQKECRIKFHVINALTTSNIESVNVTATGDIQGPMSVSTDDEGYAEVGPFVPGENVTIKVTQEGFDDIERVITANEDVPEMLLGANPTVN